ncbi:MAG: DUF4956 domain-containing protein [Oscillospiraceae bacterium]
MIVLNLFSNSSSSISIGDLLACTAASLVLGLIISLVFRYKNKASKSFLITLAMLPAIVQMVIMLVNGNLGTGVAVMGAFSLVRFRSAPGNAKDICSIFLAMATGIATGTGNIFIAAVFTVILCAVNIAYNFIPFIKDKNEEKLLKITIPENLDYSGVFDDLFDKYTKKSELIQVKTTNMGSLFKLDYNIIFKDLVNEKEFLDELRCRNGNLEISCGRPVSEIEQL